MINEVAIVLYGELMQIVNAALADVAENPARLPQAQLGAHERISRAIREARVATAADDFQDVLDFHLKLKPEHPRALPGLPRAELGALVFRLVDEECNAELLPALMELAEYASDVEDGVRELDDEWFRAKLAEAADGAADLKYVLNGAMLAYGVDLRPVWDEVQRANMAKEGGSRRPDGKILKPEGWVPPGVAGVIARQAPIPGVPLPEQ
jgi:predicted HAD superfamily Cof-like phosphohydrolase